MPSPEEALLGKLFELLNQCDYGEAAALLDVLRGRALAPEDAAELILAADMLPDSCSDASQLEDAARVLAGAGRWEHAMAAFAGAGALCSGDLAGVRRNYAAAAGCAEAGAALRLGAVMLLRLAEVELRCGSRESAAELCAHALRRLKGVPLLGARADEATAVELIGDLYAADGQHEEARRHWQDALDRFSRLEHGRAKQVRSKLGT